MGCHGALRIADGVLNIGPGNEGALSSSGFGDGGVGGESFILGVGE